MATGALIGGAILGGIGSAKSSKASSAAAEAQARAAAAQYEATKKYAGETYDMIKGSLKESRKVEKKRWQAGMEADEALGEANKAFLKTSMQSSNDLLKSAQISDREWASANKQGLKIQLGNIDRMRQERLEKQKRIGRENDITEGRMQTASSASGFGGGSSLDQWVDTARDTHESDLSWMRKAGRSSERLATMDANLEFKMSDSARRATMRGAEIEHSTTTATNAAKFDYYESQRFADRKMRAADRYQRTADRKSMRQSARIQRDSSIESARIGMESGIAMAGAQKDAARGSLFQGIGGALSGAAGAAGSYQKYGWGFS